MTYFEFILRLAKSNFIVNIDELSDDEKGMCLMLHYDVWQEARRFPSLQESISAIGNNRDLIAEIVEFLEVVTDKIDFIEKPIPLPFSQPLRLHARYTRDQILAAFGFYTFENKPSYREGVAYSKEKNTEFLFVTLHKSEEDFSPTNLYKDFAISETIFEWQTQN